MAWEIVHNQKRSLKDRATELLVCKGVVGKHVWEESLIPNAPITLQNDRGESVLIMHRRFCDRCRRLEWHFPNGA